VDDRPQNLAPAAALGMQTVHFTGAEELEGRLRELKVL
jgi:FMN phosphatase YigB (HAD superfamily)